MESIVHTLNAIKLAILANLHLIAGVLLGLCLVHVLNVVSGYRLSRLGIYPRHPLGLPGIIFSPWLHGSTNHLIVNLMSLFVLITMVLVNGRSTFICASLMIILITGGLIWVFARPACHIGASGVIMGYLGYLLANSISHPSMLTILLAVVCLYYLGGMLINLFPREKSVSWEGHVFGFIAGIVTSVLC